jgi:hypothetical protein
MEKVKRLFSFTFQWPPSMEHSNGHQAWNIPMATKHGTFQWPPSLDYSNGHQAWNFPMATKPGTFHWPPSFGSTFTSLLLLFKRRTWIIGNLSCLGDNFHAILNTCFYKFLEEANND